MGLRGGGSVCVEGMHLPWELLELDSWCGIVGKKVHPVSATHVIITFTFQSFAIVFIFKSQKWTKNK